MSSPGYHVDQKYCTGCAGCVSVCPTFAIVLEVRSGAEVDTTGGSDPRASIALERCILCGNCAQFCPVGAVREGSAHA